MNKLTLDTESYNERRYGKPWIALVTFDSVSNAQFKFGAWVGDEGYKGVLEIGAKEGDVIARGQKDYRKPANSTPRYFIFENGDLKEVSKKDAYLHYLAQQDKPDEEKLLVRKAELLAELEEIEKQLHK